MALKGWPSHSDSGITRSVCIADWTLSLLAVAFHRCQRRHLSIGRNNWGVIICTVPPVYDVEGDTLDHEVGATPLDIA
jgi:hypothetical protein